MYMTKGYNNFHYDPIGKLFLKCDFRLLAYRRTQSSYIYVWISGKGKGLKTIISVCPRTLKWTKIISSHNKKMFRKNLKIQRFQMPYDSVF